MMAIYQKSVRNGATNKPSYLNRPLPPITDDIFSQMPTQDTSYMLDSFVVSDEHVSFQSKFSLAFSLIVFLRFEIFVVVVVLESKKTKKKSAKLVERRERRERPNRIERFNANAGRIQARGSHETDIPQTRADNGSSRATRSIQNRHLLLDSQYLDHTNEEVLVLDDDEPRGGGRGEASKSSRIGGRLKRLATIEDLDEERSNEAKDDDDECEIILDNTNAKSNQKSLVILDDKQDEEDEDFELNQWLVNETFGEKDRLVSKKKSPYF